jgi:hypothetical protein
MSKLSLRWVGVALALSGTAAFGLSVWDMSQKLGEFYKQDPVVLHYFIDVPKIDQYLGRPLSFDTIETPSGPQFMVRYGESTEKLPVMGKDIPELGTIRRHEDWLRLLLLAGDAGKDADPYALIEHVAPGSKLVLVARSAAPGYDPETWGAALYKDWVYAFLVFEPDGSIMRFDRTYRELANDSRSWEFVAAMNVTPSLHTPALKSSSPISYPNYRPVRKAMDVMGWTWPVSGVSMLVMIGGVVLFGASFVSRPKRAEVERVETQ